FSSRLASVSAAYVRVIDDPSIAAAKAATRPLIRTNMLPHSIEPGMGVPMPPLTSMYYHSPKYNKPSLLSKHNQPLVSVSGAMNRKIHHETTAIQTTVQTSNSSPASQAMSMFFFFFAT